MPAFSLLYLCIFLYYTGNITNMSSHLRRPRLDILDIWQNANHTTENCKPTSLTSCNLLIGQPILESFLKSKISPHSMRAKVITRSIGWLGWLGPQNTPTASLQRSKTPPTSVLDMTLNNLMVKIQ